MNKPNTVETVERKPEAQKTKNLGNKTAANPASTRNGLHTPGPWRFEGNQVRAGSGNNWSIISQVHFNAIGKNKEQSFANARLIAAAPELLEAANLLKPVIGKFAVKDGRILVIGEDNKERLLTGVESMNFHKGFSKLFAAISKAEGK